MDDKETMLSDDQVTDIVKKKRKRPDRTEALTPSYEPGDMARMIMNAVDLSSMGPVNMHDPAQVEQRMNDYLRYTIEHDMKPTVESMALAFNCNRSTLWKWREGVETDIPEQSRNVIKKAIT